ncbi:PREDICTED: protein SODIUM POTASSIUM ROOT DEFECTIVE 1-like [Nicotiana attenuata]|uniref:protein SODIUM POTASSIUM ROOT DEFECTIVE 1-like n=1 Tax=Nicotiana attenuata TaxID=49451 RepID=UPI000905B3FD|nr:PREDICTED: protein SODIUM POTASSIUM ROOT DEFECTIVE 1-like [Nicotiana attenuata]
MRSHNCDKTITNANWASLCNDRKWDRRAENADPAGLANANKNVANATTAPARHHHKCGGFLTNARYLLGEKSNFLDALSDFEPVLKLVPSNSVEAVKTETDESCPTKPPPSSASANQVVVLRVSLHCKGCERKMRKHISRMQGVYLCTL